MKTFVDNAGRTWTVTINVDAIKRVRGLLQVDLLEIVGGELLERLIRDPVLLCDVVYAVCRPEADARSICDEDFGRAMAGDAIDHATRALLEELVDFFPNQKDRANLQRVLRTAWMVMDRARNLAERRLNSGELEMELEQALAMPGSSSGAVPESVASTPVG